MNRRELLATAVLAPLLLSHLRVASAAPDTGAALDPAAISAAQHRLSRRVIDALAKDGATVMISPASLAGAFSVIAAGASPDLVRAIGAMLGCTDTVMAADALAALTKALGQAQGDEGALAMARALVLDPALRPSASTLSRLRAGGVEVIDAAFGDLATLKRINAWVAAKTKDMIPVLLDELPPQPGLVALDALHFKDRWKRQFEAAETSARPFHAAGGAERIIQMMVSPEATWRFRKDEQFIAADLGYQTDRYSLTVVTSRDKPLPVSGFDAVYPWLDGQGFHELQGQVQLPKLALSGSHDLLDVLDALGLAPARLQPNALAGFSDGELAISKVVQRVALKIDEQGTEAAAATGIVALRSLAAGEYVQMIVDKPFMFALRDAASGLVLLSGYVADIPSTP